MSLAGLRAFRAQRRSPWRMLGYLVAPLVYFPTQSVLGAIVAAFVVIKIVDRIVERRIHYRIRLHGADDFTERPPPLERGHDAIVTGLAFSPDGGRLASCSFEGSVKLWDLAAGRVLQSFVLLKNDAQGLAFSPDGERLLVCGVHEFIVQDVARERTLLMKDAAKGESYAQALFSADGGRILTIEPGARTRDAVCRLDLRDAKTGDVVQSIGGFGLFAFSPDASVFAAEPVEGERGEVVLYRCADASEISRCRLPERFRKEAPEATSFRARTLYLAPEGRFLGVTDTDGEHAHLDPASGEVLRRFRVEAVDYPIHIALSHDARTLWMSRGSGSRRQGVFAVDAETGALKGAIGTTKSDWGVPFAPAPDGSRVAIAGEDQPPNEATP